MHIKKFIDKVISNKYNLYDKENLQSILIELFEINGCDRKIFQEFGVVEVILKYKNSLYSAKKISFNAYIICLTMHELFIRIAKEHVIGKNILSEWNSLIKYLQIAIGYEPIEQFRIILLDKKRAFIKDEIMTKGTIDQSGVYNREVIAIAMKYNVKNIIIIHNHPSGDCTPSDADQQVTESVNFACSLHNIKLVDHLIISRNSYFSFANAARLDV